MKPIHLATPLCLVSILAAGAASAGPAPVASPKLDLPSNTFYVPFFEVDTTSPGGQTTLFAVRNPSDVEVQLHIVYFTVGGELQREELVTLDAFETYTKNVRDVPGLEADPDGFARGLVQIVLTEESPPESRVVGDFFQIDVAGAFASGERLVSDIDDLCRVVEARFLDFGNPTRLRILLAQALGSEPEDPPSFIVTPFAEDGSTTGPVEVRTDDFVVFVDSSELTSDSFGTLVFDFEAGAGVGWVFAESSADGLFSVGLNGSCTVF